MSKESQKALTIMRKAQEEINQVLQGPRHINNLLTINGSFKLIENRLVYMGAVLGDSNQPTQLRENLKHKPLKAIFDRKIRHIAPAEAPDGEVLTEEQKQVVDPADLKKHKYRDAVNKLYARIGRLSPNTILTNYRNVYDIFILRGVAKVAGLEDYEKAPLTVEFISRITEAIKQKEAEAAQQQTIDKSTVKAGPGSDVMITQEQIDDDPDLQELGAKAGDVITIDKKTKRKTIKV